MYLSSIKLLHHILVEDFDETHGFDWTSTDNDILGKISTDWG